MTRNISFVKLANRWFALFPLFNEGDVDDLEMVGDASTFLNDTYNHRHKEDGLLTLKVSDEELESSDFVLVMKNDDEFMGECGKNYGVLKSRIETVSNLWMCPVLKWFFYGEYPEKIYVKYE